MLRLFIATLLILPIAEIVLLVQVGHYLGFWLTLASLAFSAVAGIKLLRWQSARTLQGFAAAGMEAGAGKGLLNGMLLSFAGILLIIPGYITDAVALLLLLPFVRKPLARWLLAKGMAGTVAAMGPGMRFSNFGGVWNSNQPPTNANVYEGEFSREQPPVKSLDSPPDTTRDPE